MFFIVGGNLVTCARCGAVDDLAEDKLTATDHARSSRLAALICGVDKDRPY